MKKFFGNFLCTREEWDRLNMAAENERRAYVILRHDSEALMRRDHADELAKVKRECEDKIARCRLEALSDIASKDAEIAELCAKNGEIEKTMHLDIEQAKLQLTKEIGMELMKVREELSAERERASANRISYNDHLEYIKKDNAALVSMNKDLLDKYAQFISLSK